MGKLVKIIFALGIVMLLLVYLGVGLYLNNSINEKITELETQAVLNNKKREYMIEQSISLDSIKKNLQSELALEKEKAKQRELQTTLDKLNEEARQSYIQQQTALAEQQRLAALAALQKQQTTTTKSTSSSSSSSKTTTTKPPTRAS